MARRSRRSWFPPIPQNKDASRTRNMYEKIIKRIWSENSTTPFENDNRHPKKELSNPLGILAQLLLAMGHSCPGYMENLSFFRNGFISPTSWNVSSNISSAILYCTALIIVHYNVLCYEPLGKQKQDRLLYRQQLSRYVSWLVHLHPNLSPEIWCLIKAC